MCPSSWKLYLDDFLFQDCADKIPLCDKKTFVEKYLKLKGEEPKKGKSSKYNFQDDGHISSSPVVHI